MASKMASLRHVTKISSLSRAEIVGVLDMAIDMKASPLRYADALKQKSLLMLFEKPSLRTRVSLEVGMTQLGGHAIAYMTGDSPLGKKETYEDTGAVLSRMVDAVTARVGTRAQIAGLAQNSTVPIINALDDAAHPMQMLADLQTLAEHKFGGNALSLVDGGLKFAFVGDCQNNVTYDLMRACAIMGIDCRVAGPPGADFAIEDGVLEECEQLGAGRVKVCGTAEEAVSGVDAIYCDSWMSYGIAGDAKAKRLAALMPFQVTASLMKLADKSAVFMNCLPAMRGEEQTAEVIDGPQSIVFDQAENRLHAQKALLVKLINGGL
ncbi:Aspartate/ornithine carbamoyltransferase [Pelagophyceae sp. CCMP2097]|nr:Aspartate/ornithine carbamoyltransferase [Pelagophyceae sp. CCMP2097]|mmetsp:Transcript_4411/g.13917  ORF Transcript_4411/g.13917 Transcript_4411/m.13917 type:complete len:322 (-) Transcript_4411:124-1089(-)